jgi:hypothetical protein
MYHKIKELDTKRNRVHLHNITNLTNNYFLTPEVDSNVLDTSKENMFLHAKASIERYIIKP